MCLLHRHSDLGSASTVQILASDSKSTILVSGQHKRVSMLRLLGLFGNIQHGSPNIVIQLLNPILNTRTTINIASSLCLPSYLQEQMSTVMLSLTTNVSNKRVFLSHLCSVETT